jgi:hypothetical protein
MSSTVVTTTTRLVTKPNSVIEYVTTETIETKEDGTEVKSESTKEYMLEKIDKHGVHTWRNKAGQPHRDGDLPAFISAIGDQYCYKDGKLHRDGDLPAIICANGAQFWYKEGKLHRDGDLPAVIHADGTQQWHKEDYLHRDGDLPAVINTNGHQQWFKNCIRHRDGDLPAIIYANGTKEWYKDGKEYTPTHLIPTPALNKDKMLAALETLQSILTRLIKEINA